jgi:hypothetical protein
MANAISPANPIVAMSAASSAPEKAAAHIPSTHAKARNAAVISSQ